MFHSTSLQKQSLYELAVFIATVLIFAAGCGGRDQAAASAKTSKSGSTAAVNDSSGYDLNMGYGSTSVPGTVSSNSSAAAVPGMSRSAAEAALTELLGSGNNVLPALDMLQRNINDPAKASQALGPIIAALAQLSQNADADTQAKLASMYQQIAKKMAEMGKSNIKSRLVGILEAVVGMIQQFLSVALKPGGLHSLVTPA